MADHLGCFVSLELVTRSIPLSARRLLVESDASSLLLFLYCIGVSDDLSPEHFISEAACEKRNIETNGVFWDVTPCGSCKNRRFGGT
jgi:hypothetical protein